MKHYLKLEVEVDNYDDVTQGNYEVHKITELTVSVEQTYYFRFAKIDIDTTGYIPQKGDKLYFLPGCSVPRVKLKDLTMQHGIKATRDADEANIIIGSNNSFSKMTTSSWMYELPVDAVLQFVDMHKDLLDDYVVDNIHSALEFYELDTVICNWSTLRVFTDDDYYHYAEIRKVMPDLFISQSSVLFQMIEKDHSSLYSKIQNKALIHESCLLEHVNGEDAIIIDKDMYDQLSTMFGSSDKDNHTLAMEIMANSRYKESLLYIEMLFYRFSHSMYDCHTKNHVNFKSLISYLSKTNSIHTDIDDIVKSLVAHNCLTRDKLDVILDNFKDDIIRRGSTDCFDIKQITLQADFLAKLGKSYVYKHLPDFEDEVKSEEIEPVVLHGDLNDLNAGVAIDIATPENEPEISDEDITVVFERMERNELKSELIALEQSEKGPEKGPETESNNNQIEEKNDGDSFEWF